MDSATNTWANRLLATAGALGVVGTALCFLDSSSVATQHNMVGTSYMNTVGVAPGVASGMRVGYAPKIEAARRVQNKATIILNEPIDGLGKTGEVVDVSSGYFHNYLLPTKKAAVATEEKLTEIRLAREAAEAEAAAELAAAKKLANSFATLGKFTVKKETGEGDTIFGSVSSQEIADLIERQMGQKINKKNIILPEITTLGTYQAEVVLHPKVMGKFAVVVTKSK